MLRGKHVTCPVCNGGKTVERDLSDQIVTMRKCFPKEPCPNCNGRGEVYQEEENTTEDRVE